MSPPRAQDKQCSRAEAVARVAAWRTAGERVVMANGVFDLLHVGHARYLEGARALGDRLVVAVNDDASAAALKGPGRPVMAAGDRALLVAALRAVDRVIVFGEPTVDGLLRELRPAVHAKGTDYRPDTVPERATMQALGGEVAVTGDPKRHASSDVVARIRAALDANDG
ncbi:MAG TPA: adenylyltransferase/cytidyltransferase family protein [Candidatus Limnocylindria bacterium]|nr:adenylyltransferase/cytidyltransferase family protein [Candidatus Limnocylindria bacterium]